MFGKQNFTNEFVFFSNNGLNCITLQSISLSNINTKSLQFLTNIVKI